MRILETVELDTEQLQALDNCPLTKRFFESNPANNWIEPRGEEETFVFPVEKEVEGKLGVNWRKIVALLVPASRIQDIIRIEQDEDPKEVERKIGQTTTALFLMGWELGGRVDSYSKAIADRLWRQKMFNQQLFNSGEGIQKYRDLCRGILRAGAWAKQRFTDAPIQLQMTMKV